MARPSKKGIDFYPLDVGFLTDIKVKRIMRSNGVSAVAILISFLNNIYRDEGYFLEWNEDICFLIAEDLNVEEMDVEGVLEKALDVGFFNKEKFEEFKIITSKGIQTRFLFATQRRVESQINIDYSLVDVTETKVNVTETKVNVNNNTTSTKVNVNKSTQSIVKDSKEKNSKVKKTKLKESKGNESKEKDDDISTSINKLFINTVIDNWNDIVDINSIININTNTKRYGYLKARIDQYGEESILEAIKNIRKSDFLRGKTSDWKVTFDWFLKPNNFIKVLEGNYNNKSISPEWEDIGNDLPF